MAAAERLRDPDKPVTEEWRLLVMAGVALERGEKRPSIEWMYKMLRIEHEVSALNREASLPRSASLANFSAISAVVAGRSERRRMSSTIWRLFLPFKVR
ncbi:hypothetical protein [Rhizobium gallicum]|nr:hypothetical protein [Rhizobium gallicum]